MRDRGGAMMSVALRMLHMPTFDEVLAAIDQVPESQRLDLAASLRSMSEIHRDIGRPVFADLGDFLATLCTRDVPGGSGDKHPEPEPEPEPVPVPEQGRPGGRWRGFGQGRRNDRRKAREEGREEAREGRDEARERSLPAEPQDFRTLIRMAHAADSPLTAHTLLRRHRHLLPPSPVRAVLHLIGDDTEARNTYAHVMGALALLAEDGAGRVTARSDWATHLRARGRYRRALFHASRAVAEQRAAGDSGSLTNAYLGLAAVLAEMGDAVAAAQVYVDAVAAVEADGTVDRPHEKALRVECAGALAGVHRYREALRQLDAAQALPDAPAGVPLHTPVAILALHARVWREAGALGAATDVYRRILEAVDRAHPSQEAVWYETVLELAGCLEERGRGREAAELVEESVLTGERTDSRFLAPLRHELGRVHIRQGRFAEAARQLLLSLFAGMTPGPFWPGVGNVFVALGDLAREDDRPEEAAGYYRDALLFEPGSAAGTGGPGSVAATGGPGSGEGERSAVHVTERLLLVLPEGEERDGLTDVVTTGCARIRERLDRLDAVDGVPPLRMRVMERLWQVSEDDGERRELARELRSGIEGAVERDAWSALKELAVRAAGVVADSEGAEGEVALLRTVLAHEERQGRSEDSMWVRLPLARLLAGLPGHDQEAFDELWTCRELLGKRGVFGPVRMSSDELAGQALPVYEELIGLLLDRGERLSLPDGGTAEQLAFVLHEEGKSRSVVEGLALHPLPPPLGVSREVLAEEAGLLLTVRRILAGLESGAPTARVGASYVTSFQQRLDSISASIGRVAPGYERLRRALGADVRDAARLVERHAPDEGMLLVSYFVGHRETFCFVIASGELRLRTYRIALGRAELHTRVEAVRRLVDGDGSVFPSIPPIRPRRPVPLPLEELSALLLPFQDALGDRELICAAPHGPLAVLPLTALRLADGAYVGERAATVYAPSVSALEYLLGAGPVPRGRALCVNVAADEDLAASGDTDFESYRLPGADGWQVTELSGLAATPHAVLSAFEECDLAYVACHGYAGGSDPRDAALILSDGRRRPSRDLSTGSPDALPFLLRARELTTPRGLPGTVVLRACSAGWQAPAHRGEDFTGLTRSLFREGTRTVVAPVWRVYSRSSAELLDLFIRNRMAGLPVWKAMWRAQQSFLTDTERPYLSHPYHWAGFVPLGDWR
ncbi:CHAT domain-containing tetratricopeptide repeat protein [Streptomyces sp. NBC_00654]|uniref:CHAT domain-containing protein n=1 Tax=Streptomyces sp. NBC_00654 TaxID=2975799 RepID=UPI002253BE17|nr:CHAT domain-containing tetratricopeptide repeat protein [Streptomyces sp. NBC_00654]MCX4963694.1 CHAT domain-containing tetratricopeptide repeat protein [Streptomyces sp. NBC_00654]